MGKQVKSQAPKLTLDIKSGKGCVKEFIADDGKTYLVICFSDTSVGVYRRKKGTGKAAADYEPVEVLKDMLKDLGATGTGSTYVLGRRLCGI